jgi:diguanylate cyclase (GGDEF)-like protein
MRAAAGHRAGRPLAWVVVGIVGVSLIGLLDSVTGAFVSFALFYLLPVCVVVWFCGRPYGVTVAVVAAVVGLVGDVVSSGSEHRLLLAWNATMRFGVFVVVSIVLDRLRASHETNAALARADPLTGVANGRWFGEAATREISGARRYGRALSVAYVDLDRFKAVNDTLGHSTGDRLLCVVAETIASGIRPTDLVARMGGDEFAVLLPSTDAAGAANAMERIRTSVATRMREHGWPVTLSVGITELDDWSGTVDDLLAAADRRMYSSKRCGRDRIVWRDAETAELHA